MAESKKELKSILMKVKEQSEKSGLKINIQQTKVMDGIWSHHFMANSQAADLVFLQTFAWVALQLPASLATCKGRDLLP